MATEKKYYILITKKTDGSGIFCESDVIATLEFEAEASRDYVFNTITINNEYETQKANGILKVKSKFNSYFIL